VASDEALRKKLRLAVLFGSKHCGQFTPYALGSTVLTAFVQSTLTVGPAAIATLAAISAHAIGATMRASLAVIFTGLFMDVRISFSISTAPSFGPPSRVSGRIS
jgi:hypothetical protein